MRQLTNACERMRDAIARNLNAREYQYGFTIISFASKCKRVFGVLHQTRPQTSSAQTAAVKLRFVSIESAASERAEEADRRIMDNDGDDDDDDGGSGTVTVSVKYE